MGVCACVGVCAWCVCMCVYSMFVLLLECELFVCFLSQIYPYLVLNDAHMVKCRREERVLQLISMMNLCLEKDKVGDVIAGHMCVT